MRESARALEAYRCYESLGPARSIDKVAQQLDKSRQLIGRWCTAHAWVERAAAYERKLAEQAAAEEADERRRARKQRLQVARGARSKGVEALTLLGAHELAHLPSAIIRLLEYADGTERKDLGEPDQLVQVAGQLDLSVDVRSLSSVELDAYVGRLQAAISAGGAGEAPSRSHRRGADSE